MVNRRERVPQERKVNEEKSNEICWVKVDATVMYHRNKQMTN